MKVDLMSSIFWCTFRSSASSLKVVLFSRNVSTWCTISRGGAPASSHSLSFVSEASSHLPLKKSMAANRRDLRTAVIDLLLSSRSWTMEKKYLLSSVDAASLKLSGSLSSFTWVRNVCPHRNLAIEWYHGTMDGLACLPPKLSWVQSTGRTSMGLLHRMVHTVCRISSQLHIPSGQCGFLCNHRNGETIQSRVMQAFVAGRAASLPASAR